MKWLILIAALIILPGCTLYKKWAYGDIWRAEDTQQTTATTIPHIDQCAQCGKGIRVNSEAVQREVTVYEHKEQTPMISYGPTLGESTVLGEGYQWPKWVKARKYVVTPVKSGKTAFIVGGQWSDDLCWECNKGRME